MSTVATPGAAGAAAVATPGDAGARKRGWTGYLLLAPGGLWLVAFFLVPTVTLLISSLYDPSGSLIDGYTLTGRVANYTDAISQYSGTFIRSLVYALAATAACVVLGYPLAYAIAFKAGRWKNLMLVAVIAPFFTSFLVRTLAWKLLLGDHGVIVDVLQTVHILGPDGRLLATPFAVVTGLTYNFLPFMVLPLYASLEKIDLRLVEAASDLYSSPVTAFRKVTLPLSMPGLVAGTLLTFIPASGDYLNAELLGNPRTRMIGNDIQDLFSAGALPQAASLSVTLMALIVVMVLVYVRRAGTEELV
ncbi:MAG TPA: ABC transporter permease [Marmoricola sp.]|nr:ABC transporter permease [Marmoricola sp.]